MLKMKIGIIGRTEILYKTCLIHEENGYDIQLLITSREAPEYKKRQLVTSKFFPQDSIVVTRTSQINNDDLIIKKFLVLNLILV